MKPYLPPTLALLAAVGLTGCSVTFTHGQGPYADGHYPSSWAASHSQRGYVSASSSAGSSASTPSTAGQAAPAPTPVTPPPAAPPPLLRPGRYRQPSASQPVVGQPGFRASGGGAASGAPTRPTPERTWTLPWHDRDDIEMFGTTRLTGSAGRTTVRVTGDPVAYQVLHLHVDGKPVQLGNVRVVFADGQSYAPRQTYTFTVDSWTYSIQLPAPAREVDRVEFTYVRTGRYQGDSTLLVFGER